MLLCHALAVEARVRAENGPCSLVSAAEVAAASIGARAHVSADGLIMEATALERVPQARSATSMRSRLWSVPGYPLYALCAHGPRERGMLTDVGDEMRNSAAYEPACLQVYRS